MADETKIQWHPTFCSAIELTLLDNADSLDYTREFHLSRKLLQVDLLVINKDNKKETAERMIRAEKYTDMDIVDISGLTLSQVKALREEMKTAVMA